ncbi:MAG: hypothetical protein AAF716_21285 [Cyanobacteria bacterium P01_D01_bin.1]
MSDRINPDINRLGIHSGMHQRAVFEYLVPRSAEVRQASEALQLHQAAIDFQREAAHRQAFADYCEWYYKLAEQNKAEMLAMENDSNSFMWWRGAT